MSWTALRRKYNRTEGGMKPCFDRLPGLQVSLIAGCNLKPGDDRRVPIDSLCLALR